MPIIDSALTYEEATRDNPAYDGAPDWIRQYLRLVKVWYYSYDGEIHEGQIVVHQCIASRVRLIFAEMLHRVIPIAKVVPIVSYGWDDERSMQDNATSGYHWRVILGTDRISFHGLGLALDINPLWNPWMKDGATLPTGAVYDPTHAGTLTADSLIVEIMKKHGFDWAGDWLEERGYVDYQHFAFLRYDMDGYEYLRSHEYT